MRFVIAALRSTLYFLLQIIITPPYALVVFVTYPLSPLNRYRVISRWSHIMLFLARFICGVRYCVLGTENIPKEPAIVLSKHQSAWETLAFQQIFPPQVWVLKKELLHIPFFGWGLAMTSPIAINRSQGKAALKQIIRQAGDYSVDPATAETLFRRCLESEDFQEGLAAKREKRSPIFAAR